MKNRGEYDPNHLLNTLLFEHRLENDAELSKFLEVSAPVISKIRNFKVPLNAGMLIRMHEVTGKSIKELRALMGDRLGM